jgi:predicted ArsR family transcriptional regulator
MIFADAIERSGGEVALYTTARERGVAAGRALATASGASPAGANRTNASHDEAAPLEEATHQDMASSSGERHAVEYETEGVLERELDARGYAPFRDAEVLRLRNCPFHALAQEFPVVACGMNLALLGGILAGLGTKLDARMEPRPGECCVVIDVPPSPRAPPPEPVFLKRMDIDIESS